MKKIVEMLDSVLDENGNVLDNASEELRAIRMNLYRKRNELRRVFDRIVQRLHKQGYLSDIEEAFINGRRVVAIFAEQKRMVKGILHGESDTRKTSLLNLKKRQNSTTTYLPLRTKRAAKSTASFAN